MEKNDFLLFNEILYRVHACQTLEELQPTLLNQLKLIIPYSYATVIGLYRDEETQEVKHGAPFCVPRQFEEMERAWIAQVDQKVDQSYSLWLSHAVDSLVIRDSEIMEGENRFRSQSYQEYYSPWNVADCMQMNIICEGRPAARMALYRTRADGVFTDQEAFYLRAMSNHINLAYGRCLDRQRGETVPRRSLAEIIEKCDLTRREGEILRLIFQDLNNEELTERLSVSRNTLLKHLQNIYRKCGVSSRLDLLKLRP